MQEFRTQNMATDALPSLLLCVIFGHLVSFSHTHVPPLYVSCAKHSCLFWLSEHVQRRESGCHSGEGKYLQCRGELRGAGPGLNYGVCHLLCNPAKLEYTHWPTSAGVRSSG